ncbi:MAG: 30S ribosome-binding factor RbfA [Kiritimatiellae bacterium]|jgi:ribosome-binding factor A|nr:30S ribosome-binding factor RbfA [Kiritimatiellia bacterium]
MSVNRIERVNSLLRRVIAEAMFQILRGEDVSPALVTVTGVSCGSDLRDATVGISVFGDAALKRRAMERLRRNAARFQAAINREVKMKYTPRLFFKLDRSIEKGDEVLAILDRLENKSSSKEG